MISQEDIKKIKEAVQDFFEKMTVEISIEDISFSNTENDVVNLSVSSLEPQILIGQGGQTLFEIQRLLRTILNKKLQKVFYFNLDINDYKTKKIEYLKVLAKDSADQVALTKEEKAFPPMPSYERRIIHAELSQRTDVATESQGEGSDRHIVIRPK
jgi:spoIIIJ-associated protein